MATEQETGVRYLLRKRGGRTIEITGPGRFRLAGDFRQNDGTWGAVESARYYTQAEKDRQLSTFADRLGAEWVTVYVEVTV